MENTKAPLSVPTNWILDHIGIAVHNLDQAIRCYEGLFQTGHYGREVVPSQGVEVAFLDVQQGRIELLSATHEDSSVSKFLSKRGEGMHHTAYRVPSVRDELERLAGLGWELIHKEPIMGAHGKKIAFLHPKSAHGVLIELCEKVD